MASGLTSGCISANPEASPSNETTAPLLAIGDDWTVGDNRWRIEALDDGPNRHGFTTARAALNGSDPGGSWWIDRTTGDVVASRHADGVPSNPGNSTGAIHDALETNPLLGILALQYAPGDGRWFGNPSDYRTKTLRPGTLRVVIPIQNQDFSFDISHERGRWTLHYAHMDAPITLHQTRQGSEPVAVPGPGRLPDVIRPTPAGFDRGTCEYPFSWPHVLEALRTHPSSALWLREHPDAVVDLFSLRVREPHPVSLYTIDVGLVQDGEGFQASLFARQVQDPTMTVALWQTFEADPTVQPTSSVPLDALVCRFETWTGIAPMGLTRIDWRVLTPRAGPDDPGIFVRLERQDEVGETIVIELEGTLAGLQKGLRLPPGVIDQVHTDKTAAPFRATENAQVLLP